jgi:formate-dependent nitrite reductase membrane component NrfD
MLAKENVTVRKPEQGTAPKLFYIDGHDASMIPTATTEGDQFMWSENKPHKPQSETPRPKAKSGLSSQGAPRHGNYARGGTVAEQMVQVGYNVWHKEYWHWQVPAYIVTKDIAAGLFLMVSTLLLLGFDPGMDLHKIALVSLGFTIITTAFLVLDLEKPLRFLYILFRPQWRSWLTRGAFVLIGFSLVQTLWVGIELAAVFWSEGLELTSWRDPLLGWGIPLAVLTAIYTAFLFGQAEGRDLWQHPLLPIQLLVRTLLAGSAVVLLMGAQEWHHNANLQLVASVFFPVTVLINLFMVLIGEVAMPHASNVAAAAAKDIIKGRYKYWFWIGGIGIGSILPLAIGTFSSSPLVVSTAAISALVGIFILEYLFVMAPQRVPNS